MISFNLWTLLVDNLFGSFWMAILGIAIIIFIIMAVMGRMTKVTIAFYLMDYFLIMAVCYGYKWISVLITFAVLMFVYLAVRNATND